MDKITIGGKEYTVDDLAKVLDGAGKVKVGDKEYTVTEISTVLEKANARESEFKDLIKQRDELKAKAKTEEEEKLKEQGKYKELYEAMTKDLEGFKATSTTLEAALKQYTEAEIADVPEDKRGLIPDLPLDKKLVWLKEAKKQGLFGKQDTQDPPGARLPGNQGGIKSRADLTSVKAKSDFIEKYGQDAYLALPATVA